MQPHTRVVMWIDLSHYSTDGDMRGYLKWYRRVTRSTVCCKKHSLALNACHHARCKIGKKHIFFPDKNGWIRVEDKKSREYGHLSIIGTQIHAELDEFFGVGHRARIYNKPNPHIKFYELVDRDMRFICHICDRGLCRFFQIYKDPIFRYLVYLKHVVHRKTR